MKNRADSLLTFDLRAFARDYAGTPFGSRCKTAADELDRLYEIERMHARLVQANSPTPPQGDQPGGEGG